MVSPRDAMEAVAQNVAQSGELPPEMSLLLHEADQTASDADVEMPLLEIQPVEVEHVILNNDDFVGYATDNDDNQIGRIYLSDFEMGISLNIWTSVDDQYDPDDLGERLRSALYPHSSYGPQEPFLDEDRNPIDQITHFRLDTGERVDDLLQTPTVRRWSQEVELWGYEEFRTDKDYIASVNFPSSGDFNDTDSDGVIENT
jgi:hypothetical protein